MLYCMEQGKWGSTEKNQTGGAKGCRMQPEWEGMEMNISEVLGAMVQSGMSASSNDRIKNALGGDALDRLTGMIETPSGKDHGGGLAEMVSGALRGGRESGGIGDLLSGMLGGSQQGTSAAAGGGIGDLLTGMLGEAGRAVGGRQNVAIGGLGALLGSLLGGGGKSLGGAVGGGLMALLGALAFNALKGSAGHRAMMPVGLLEPQTPQEQAQLDENSELVLRAMINAIKADSRVDQNEIERMMGKFSEAGIDDEGRHYLMGQLRQPMETERLITAAEGQPELAAQIYAASLMAIEVDTPEERSYLDRLAAGMGLAPQVAKRIEQMVGLHIQ